MIAKSSYGTADSPSTVVHHTQENTSESTLTSLGLQVVFILVLLAVPACATVMTSLLL